jgi:hypothetical protein
MHSRTIASSTCKRPFGSRALEQTFYLLLLRTAVEVIWAKVLVLIAALNM